MNDEPIELPEYEISAEKLLTDKVESLPCLVEPILPKVGLGALVGGSDTGKSAALRQLAIEVATNGDAFAGYSINATHQSAIYVASEDDQTAMSFLLNKFNVKRNLPETNYRNLRFIFETQDLIKKLDQSLLLKPADLVVIDAFGDIFSGDIKDSQKVRECLNTYSDLAKEHNCLILFLHHTGKGRENNGPSKNNILGSQAFEAKMRIVLELRQDQDDDALRHLCVVKGNYLPSSLKNESIALLFDDALSFTKTEGSKAFADLAKNEDTPTVKLPPTKLIPFLAVILEGKELISKDIVNQIIEQFGVSNKTVYSAIDALITYKTPIPSRGILYQLNRKEGVRNAKIYSLVEIQNSSSEVVE